MIRRKNTYMIEEVVFKNQQGEIINDTELPAKIQSHLQNYVLLLRKNEKFCKIGRTIYIYMNIRT